MGDGGSKPHKTRAGVFPIETGVFLGGHEGTFRSPLLKPHPTPKTAHTHLHKASWVRR